MSYVEVNDIITAQIDDEMANPDRPWVYKGILSHTGPMTLKSEGWKGSKYNLNVQWEDGAVTSEPLNQFGKDDPVTCAVYAKDNNLLDKVGWRFLRKHARRTKKLKRTIKQYKMQRQRRGPIYKFGVRVPRDWKEARRLQEDAGHTKWTDAEKLKLAQLAEYETFHDLGKEGTPPDDYKKISVHFVYDAKHCGRYKARMVAGGHLTDPCREDSYSSVVSLKSLRLALTIGELNGLKPMVGDISNAYLESYTKEKVYIVAGPEFGPLAGHVLLISKALYGLRTSGARFHEKLADSLRDLGFAQSYTDPDLWIRDAGNCYEYLCIWVDDIMAVLKEPEAFYDDLRNKCGYKLKGVGDPEYHLGGNFGRDPDGTLYWSAKTYVQKMMDNYERLFDSLPKQYSAPLDPDDSPELDTSEFLDENDIKIYQSLIGCVQWAITLGRFDIAVCVMTLSRFRIEPRIGHMERLKRIYGYLRKFSDAAIRFRTNIPNNEEIFGEMPDHEWMHTVYGETKDEFMMEWPKPKGKTARISHFHDANLMHCKVTGKSCTGTLSFVNQTPVHWFAKLQNTVETATYGSEFVSARTSTEQVMDTRYSLMAMGVPIEESAWMMGDNQSVITQSTTPSSMLTKRHQILSYHRTRWAIAAGIIKYVKVCGKENVSDVLTKFLPHSVAWPLIKPVLFWRGETMNIEK